MAVLPRPMSSARHPPSPSRSRNRSQARPRRWYGRSSPTNPAGSWTSSRRSSGSPASSSSVHAATLGGGATGDGASSSPSPASLSSVDGIHHGVLADVVLEPLAGPAHRRRIDAHPAPAAVQQRRAGALGALELGIGDRRRTVVLGDDEAPVDDGLAPEPRAVVGAVLGRRPAAHGDPGAHEALRADELDAARRELGRRLLEEALGVLDGELEADGFVLASPGRRRPRCTRRPSRGERGDLGLQARRGGRGRRPPRRPAHGVPDVVGRAPAPGVELVDELEAHLPVVVRVVGHDEADAGQHDGLAAQAPLVALEARRQRGELLGVGDAAAADHGSGTPRARSTERAADIAGSRLLGSGGPPVAVGQAVAGERVDHRGVDVGDGRRIAGSARRSAASPRRGRVERGDRRWSSATGTHRATGMSRSWRIRGATSPAPTVAAASRATAASQASESDCVARRRRGPRSQRAARSAGEAHRGRADRLAVGQRHVERREVADQERVGRRAPLRREERPVQRVGQRVWAPSHPHRCRLPSTQEPTIAGAGRSSAARPTATVEASAGGGWAPA